MAALAPDLPGPPLLTGPADTPAPMALETFLHDVLPLFPAATAITVTTTDTSLSLRVTGPAPHDPALLKETATDHGATTTFEPGNATVEWSAEH